MALRTSVWRLLALMLGLLTATLAAASPHCIYWNEGSGLDARTPTVPAILIQPYLQLPRPHSIRILWETSIKSPSRVEFGLSPKLGHSADGADEVYIHEVELAELNPATTYYYRVRSGDLRSEVFSFKTAPPLGTREWRMVLFGDSRSNPAVLRKLAERIAGEKVDLMVHSGDIVVNGRVHDLWRKEFFDPLGPLAQSTPWISSIGNHELDSENYYNYVSLPGNERHYGFDFCNAHFICLDSSAPYEKGRDKQTRWLTEHLAEQRDATWTFAVFHHGLFSAHVNRPIHPLRWEWGPIFLDPANHVDGVLTGHDHFYARNYRMGRVGDEPQPGVLFLTSAGGGAPLYRSTQRDYIAREKAAWHFTLFEFRGDEVRLTAVDLAGAVIDSYVLTKKPTPPEQYCSYEVEELRQFLRVGLGSAAPIRLEPSGPTTIDRELRIPTRFKVPVEGELIWQKVDGWKVSEPNQKFHLAPGAPLVVPLQAEVADGAFPRTPELTIQFAPGKFCNRTIVLSPFKLAGPDVVKPRASSGPIEVNGKVSEDVWTTAATYPLLAVPSHGGRGDQVQFASDDKYLYLAAKLTGATGKVEVAPPETKKSWSRALMFGEHFRVVVSDGKKSRTFALAPLLTRWADADGKEDDDTEWMAAATSSTDGWRVMMRLPRDLFPERTDLRINVVHRQGTGSRSLDYELSPTYSVGSDPDLLPDWRPGTSIDAYAHLKWTE
jgi:hypothetical protein